MNQVLQLYVRLTFKGSLQSDKYGISALYASLPIHIFLDRSLLMRNFQSRKNLFASSLKY